MSEDFDFLTKGIKEVENLNKHKLYVGSILNTGDRTIEYNQLIAEVQDNGATINPVRGKFLTIPMPIAGKRHAGDIDGLFFHKSKQGQPTLARMENGKLVVYFLLKTQVKIPARPFFEITATKVIGHVADMIADGVTDIYCGKSTAGQVFEKIGKYVTVELKRTMAEIQSPKNATITEKNKGFNNPLVDTGALLRSMSWVVI